jgi:predicted signal transduction protein with EAL and GGDEF domain
VTIAYGKDEVRDVGELLVRAQRDNDKVPVRDVLRDDGFRKEMELERTQEQKRLRAAALGLELNQKIDRGPNMEPRPWAQPMSHLRPELQLTNLPNRASFKDDLQRTIALADPHSGAYAVLFLDLDDFILAAALL